MKFVDTGINLAGLGSLGKSSKREREQVRAIEKETFRLRALEKQSGISKLQLLNSPRGGGTLGGSQAGSRGTLG